MRKRERERERERGERERERARERQREVRERDRARGERERERRGKRAWQGFSLFSFGKGSLCAFLGLFCMFRVLLSLFSFVRFLDPRSE